MNIIDENNLLSHTQKKLLTECAQKNFRLGDYTSLDDVVTKLKVDVLIESGIPKRSVNDYYEKARGYWRKVFDKLSKMVREDDSLWNEYQKAEIKLGRVNSEREAHSQMSLLGLYDSQKNIIKLFPDAMADVDAGKMDEYLVSTIAHEVMHAYFNRPGHEKYPYAMFVEEPLAEFGMLLNLYETQSPYYYWAHDNVKNKKCCYRYGADIMNQYKEGDKSLREYLEDYKILIREYEMPDILNDKVFLPKKDCILIDGQTLVVNWRPLFNIPSYFWDKNTQTLGLDGDWVDNTMLDRHFSEIHRIHCIKNLYLGGNFFAENNRCIYGFFHFDLSDCNIMISPANQYYKMEKGIVMSNNGEVAPIYESCGHNKYRIPTNGKFGIFDCSGTQIVPCKYDSIWSFDNNGLCMVRLDQKHGYFYGYVNEQGVEQIPVEYEDISGFENGVTTAKKNGFYGIIDEHNNIVHPFDLDYPDMRDIRNGYATMKNRTGKWGAIDSTGNVVIPCIYDSLVVFDKTGLAKVEQNGEEFTIDKFGNRIGVK